MGYICLKTTFLQLKHVQKIYLTLLSTTCVKIHQIPCAIFETTSNFHETTHLYHFSSNIAQFCQKYPIKVQIFRLFTSQVKSFFKQKSEFLFKLNSLFTFLAKTVHDLGKSCPSKCKILDFRLLTKNFTKFVL